MNKIRLPRWVRIIRYNLNCIWYHVLMPVGMPEDEFSKMMKSKSNRSEKRTTDIDD